MSANILEKESTRKLVKFWESVDDDTPTSPPSTVLEDISEDTTTPYPPQSALAQGLLEKHGFRLFSGKMDHSKLTPSAFGAPNRSKQIQDARDMYQMVVRNAERAGTEVPPYDFVELIGKGGYGRVYKCRKRDTGALVAVKIINIDDADFQEHVLDKDNTIMAFQKEVGILQQLKDNKAKNINMIHEAFDLHNQLWIVSDYCTGGSLRTLMRANTKQGFDEQYIIPVARELAIALKSVHDLGVVHRDIKCANVYVNEEGEIQLGDFGIVGQVEEGGASSKRRTIIGTPHYLPMEMITAKTHQTAEGYGTELDIWSFGATVFEMATGQPPYHDVPPHELREAIINAPRLKGGDYSDGLRDFVAFCLNVDPRARPTAEQVLQHPYIAGSTHKYPTRILVKLIEKYLQWEYGGGQRHSLFIAGGAAPVVVPIGESNEDEQDDALDWNFSTSDTFNEELGRRYSQLVLGQTPGSPDFEAPAGAGLPPIVTKDLSRVEQAEEYWKERSANRGERSLGRVFDAEKKEYALHTPVDDDDGLSSDLPLRNLSGTAPTRESMIDLDSAAALDLVAPTFNFDFGDVPTLKARTSHSTNRDNDDGGQPEYGVSHERRATMEWKFPAEEKKRATMDWSFSTAEATEPDEPDVTMTLPPIDSEGAPPGFRPTLQRMATEPIGKFNDFMHPAQPLVAGSSSPVRDSIHSMIDLDMGLADPAEIVRPSTANSTADSTMTDMTSGNPFDLEEDPEQNERDLNRFSFHKQWQSEGGNQRRRSHKHMQMHSRGSSLTSTDSELDRRMSHPEQPRADDVFDYDYSRSLNDVMQNGLAAGGLQIPENETSMDHWPNFGQDSGLDDVPQYSRQQYAPRLGEDTYPLQQGLRTSDFTPQPSTHAPRQRERQGLELEFPQPMAPHPDSLLENAEPGVVAAEMERLLDDFGMALRRTGEVLRTHSGVRSTDESGYGESENELGSGSERHGSTLHEGHEEGF
ncbi:hypothetical protein LTR62_003687 [Meristemomyces frigidus]|uniref:non-specific serine/threonine protein kinase n=1 Tax=Meristemomyces frigidus TaxID=1508187 RepID=A0AAN7TIH3_9PEZI|nr:hypothetical protein LTR62_003687 [Meristemomyces frigidus]